MIPKALHSRDDIDKLYVKKRTGNCVRKWNLTFLPSGICTNQEPFQRLRQLKILWDFEKQINHLILVKKTKADLVVKKKKKKKKEKKKEKKKRTWRTADLAVPVGHRLKKSKRLKSTWTLPKELTKLQKIKVTMILIMTGTFRTAPKGLERGMEELEIGVRIETIHTTALRRVLRPEETCCHLDSRETSSANAGVKHS